MPRLPNVGVDNKPGSQDERLKLWWRYARRTSRRREVQQGGMLIRLQNGMARCVKQSASRN